MSFRAVKGTRDFYPEDMRVLNWIIDGWRRVSLRNGFEEYDSPIFEYLDLFTAKSGDEIAGQLFSFTDRGGRQLAIRPETTPSLARMVNAKISSLPRPIKWFSISRLCRAENPQKGRLREFFQWNVDVIGEDSELADAECIFAVADFLREVGLTPDEVKICIGSRPLTIAALRAAGVPAEATDAALAVLDKRPKVTPEDFDRLARGIGMTDEQIAAIRRFQDCRSTAEVGTVLADAGPEVRGQIDTLGRMLESLSAMGVADYCCVDMRIVRGLAYYTGIVYEVFDSAGDLRALAGGGRYDNLLEVLGGPRIGATGMGMGDAVLRILLEQRGKLPSTLRSGQLEFFVVADGTGMQQQVISVVGALRAKGLSADFSYKQQALGKQLKEANRRGAKRAVIVREAGVAVKDLKTGQQQDRATDEFLARPL